MKSKKIYYRQSKTYECFGCKKENKKREFKLKTIQGTKVYVCQKCWYYCSPCIFTKKQK